MSTLFGDEMAVVKHNNKNEWYTNAKYIEAARSVMGGIDLDPASCAEANKTVRAARYYSLEDDGITSTWYGNVWLNAPFSEQAIWTQKAVREYEHGSLQQIILLLQAATERVWFQPLYTYPICFANHQIMFNRPNAEPYHIYHGICFVYLGANEAKFIEVFSQFGHIVKAIDTPKSTTVQPSLWEVSA
ncbi:MAG TPA: DNA N-6-adenine-methyltransferase [Dictyobacter sp.]|jgi:ParB family chromosome partitioning protein|nr:DNA N-6-adenine-methyltransferase [Dictyobacter sp.]